MIIVCLFLQSRAVRIDTGTGASVDVALTAVSIAREEVLLPLLESMQFIIITINHNGVRKLKESELSDGFGFGFAPQNEQGGTRALSSTSSSVFGFRSLTVFGFRFLSKTPSVMATATTIAVTSTTLITMTLVRRGRVDMALCFRHGRKTCHV